ncbi:MAG: aspartate aminotransferase [Candidatus Cloacimonadota bacterium]|jgi:aspartate/methionine/tyrosine aminotransferase|nr:aspartate aminotransferase [Candidatus Cloacimonadota bacterium]
MIAERLRGQKKSIIRQIVDSAPQNSINLGLGELTISTFSKKNREIYKKLQNETAIYTPNAGLPELILQIKKYYNAPQAYVCVTNGAEEAIFATLFSILNAEDELLVANPDYPAYANIAKLLNVKCKSFDRNPQNNFQLEKKSLQESITPNTKAIIISNPSNPLSITYTSDELDFIIKLAHEHNIVLIIDEIYKDLLFSGSGSTAFGKNMNIVVVSGLSKSYQLTGWRLGWVITQQEELAQAITISHQYISTCAGYFAQRIATEILQQHQQNSLKTLKEKLLANRDLASNLIKNNTNWKILLSQAAPYLFVNIESNSLEFSKQKAAEGVIVIPGVAFGKNGAGWIRINYAIEKSQLIKGIELLSNFS